MRIRRSVTLATAIVVIAGVAGGYAVYHAQRPGTAPATATTPDAMPPAAAPRDPVLEHLDSSVPVPSAHLVTHRLTAPARAVSGGAHLVGEVVDAEGGTQLWAADPARPAPPASTTKLLTAAAALLQLGPTDTLTTTTRRSGSTVYLVGGGDPTLVRSASSTQSASYPRPATLADLAHRTAAALSGRKHVRVRYDASLWTGPGAAAGWRPNYVTEGDITPPSALELDEGRLDPQSATASRTTQPAAQAGAAFVGLLHHAGIDVVGAPRPGRAPAGSADLASVSSAPVSQLVQRMLTVSDDDLAEALGRAVALHDHQAPSFAGAARAVTHAVASLGVSTTGVSLRDTSGLSHLDRVPPQTLVELLRAVVPPRHPQLRPLLEGLPVAGLTGTLSDRYLTKPSELAAGVLRAKTGTLTGVNDLAGLVVDRSGRLLLFAFLASHAAAPGLTVAALDRLASRLAQCGCTPQGQA